MYTSYLKLHIVTIFLKILNTHASVEGENVCIRYEPYFFNIQVTKNVPIQERYFGWCWNKIFPSKCTKYRTLTKVILEEQRMSKLKIVNECCTGYYEFVGTCEPMCPNQCLHGTCIAPNKCSCVNGYSGERCEIPGCPLGKYGKNCWNDCACINDATCDPNDGSCICTDGFVGRHCEEKCPEGKFGKGCTKICDCVKGSCDHVTGTCTCHPGWTGSLCDETCPEGTHGASCKSVCTCQNSGHCHTETGRCICTIGWSGPHCASPCPEYYWGTNCSNVCSCENGAKCHHISGECMCEPGFTGSQCSDICPDGLYGPECSTICYCKIGTICNNVDGTCTYPSGQNYVRCPENTWGDDCLPCDCVQDHSEGCNLQTGKCHCLPGWAHNDCSLPCPPMKFGDNCSEECTCENHIECSSVNGSCTCLPGYRGRECKDICPPGTFGFNCAQKCDRSGTCDPITGTNICTALGYTGPKCSEKCKNDHYGQNCMMKCKCIHGSCHHETGRCYCDDDWTGTDCDKHCPEETFGPECRHNTSSCPDNFYGDHCRKQCNCQENSVCDSREGCKKTTKDASSNGGTSTKLYYLEYILYTICIIKFAIAVLIL